MLMLVAGAGLLVAVSVMSVAAAPNTAEIPNDIPATALYADGVSHPIAGNASLWYKFDYSANGAPNARTPLTLTLENGTNMGVTFDVYSADQIATWWQNDPIGRGTSQSNLGVQSKNLTWVGKFQESGVQYIKITNTSPNAAAFTLMLPSQDKSGS
jgi:hypothetical protein